MELKDRGNGINRPTPTILYARTPQTPKKGVLPPDGRHRTFDKNGLTPASGSAMYEAWKAFAFQVALRESPPHFYLLQSTSDTVGSHRKAMHSRPVW